MLFNFKKVVNSVRSCKMVGCIKHSIFTEKKPIVGCKNEVQFPFRLMAAIVEDLCIKLRIAYHICLVVGHCLAVFVGAIL